MKNKDKYYTPPIEEFGINDEVYILDTSNYKTSYSFEETYPIIATVTSLSNYPTIWARSKKTNNLYEIYEGMVGFKCLDKEDIESFGLKYDGNDVYSILDYTDKIGRYNIIHLIKRFDHILISVGNKSKNVSEFDTIFAGIVKNKKEFAKVLKQLKLNISNLK